MPKENVLPEELASAARNLEDQFRKSNLPICKFPQKDWDALSPDIRNLIPAWIPVLLSNFGLASGWLEFPSPGDDPSHLSGFLGPEGLEYILKPGSEYRELIGYDFFPFALEEGSGSVWVVKFHDGPEGNVYLLELTGWSGGAPTEKNGLIYPHKNLAHLLPALTVWDEKSS